MLVLSSEQLPVINLTKLAFELGLEVLQAAKLSQAKEILQTQTLQIILLPVTIEDEPTSDLIRSCLLENPNIQVILVVNRNQINEAAEAMRLGVSDCLFKPFSQERLIKTLSAAVKRIENRAESGSAKLPMSAQKAGAFKPVSRAVSAESEASQDPVVRRERTDEPPEVAVQASHLLSYFHGLSLAQIERIIIEEMIRAEDGSVTRAASTLRVAPSTLYRKLENWKKFTS